CVRRLLQRRKKRANSERPRSQQPDPQLLRMAGSCLSTPTRRQINTVGKNRSLGISKDHSQRSFTPHSRDHLVRFFRLIDRETMRVERLQVELPLGKKLKKTLHVARFRP